MRETAEEFRQGKASLRCRASSRQSSAVETALARFAAIHYSPAGPAKNVGSALHRGSSCSKDSSCCVSFLSSLSPFSSATPPVAQEIAPPRINVTVDLVQLNVAVTDNKGKYVTGLRPQDFVVTEDGIPEDIATFGEGNGSARAR